MSLEKWSIAGRLFFKFLFIYIILFGLPIQFLYQDAVIWIGQNIAGFEGEISTDATGSGDMLIHWLFFFSDITVALLGTLLWSVIDFNRKSYPRAAEFLYIFVRYFLAFTLIGYGLAKAIPNQFPAPSLIRLTQEFGESSPMGLAWTFLGFSTGYQIFSGLMELIGGTLLLFRRTVLVGALVIAAVMINVFLINLSFDVPVKIFSAHLLLLAIGLISLHIKPLWNFFIMHRQAQLNARPFPIADKDWKKVSYTAKAFVIIGIIALHFFSAYFVYTSRPQAPEIAGIYYVEEFSLNNESVAPLTTNNHRWQRVVVDDQRAGLIAVDYMDGNRVKFNAHISAKADSIFGEIPVNPSLGDGQKKEFESVFESTGNELLLKGMYGADSLHVRLKQKNNEEILLLNRGFNWVNDTPFNQ